MRSSQSRHRKVQSHDIGLILTTPNGRNLYRRELRFEAHHPGPPLHGQRRAGEFSESGRTLLSFAAPELRCLQRPSVPPRRPIETEHERLTVLHHDRQHPVARREGKQMCLLAGGTWLLHVGVESGRSACGCRVSVLKGEWLSACLPARFRSTSFSGRSSRCAIQCLQLELRRSFFRVFSCRALTWKSQLISF